MQNHRLTLKRLLGAFVILLVAVAGVFALACVHAGGVGSPFSSKSYSMLRVQITAELSPDGDLHVTEQRAFVFTGSFSAVWWAFDSLPDGASLKIEGMRVADADATGAATGEFETLPSEAFQAEWRDEGGPALSSYSLDSPMNTVYAFYEVSDASKVFELEYTVENAAQAYSDVGELYWQFLSSEWQAASENVTLTLLLPIPASQAVTPGENVRAWAHGPLDADISIDSGGAVVFSASKANEGTFAEVRVVFPTDWLYGVQESDVNAHMSTAQLDTATSEEQKWADSDNAQRTLVLGAFILALALCVAALVWGIREFVCYRRELAPTFTEKYWRDVPVLGEHPALVARLCRFGKASADDFAATALHLAEVGALRVGRGSCEAAPDGAERGGDYCLTRVPKAELGLNSEIDRQATGFLFDTVAGGKPRLFLDEVKAFAKANPTLFVEGLTAWQGQVTRHMDAGGYFEVYAESKRWRCPSVAAGLLFACLATAVFSGMPLVIVPGAITAAVLVVAARFVGRCTQKGVDAYARSMALKRWLADRSTQNGQPTHDVGVRDELSVYALILDVDPSDFGTAMRSLMREATAQA